MTIADLETRRAEPSDADEIALAHRDSIRTIGAAFYPPNVVADWEEGLTRDVYRKAMARGEVFFIATGTVDRKALVLGFASDYRIEGSTHGMSVYVRGIAARRGIGSALLRLAEAHAVANGATSIQVEASLAGVAFYKANGFTEVGRGETHLMSGRPIACVFMHKDLGVVRASPTSGG
jgi:putative acetyltransferase